MARPEAEWGSVHSAGDVYPAAGFAMLIFIRSGLLFFGAPRATASVTRSAGVQQNLALAWLATLLLWWRSSGRPLADNKRAAATGPPTMDLAGPLKRFKQACADGDARAARSALLEWSAARWPGETVRGLDELARRLGGEAASILRNLDRQLYAGDAAAWNGSAAWRELRPLLQNGDEKQNASVGSALPDLYPSRI